MDSALGGVLYVVDAFSLFNENIAGADESGAEAVRTLLKRAEDDWETLIIILSGPQKPMEKFLASNPRLEAGSMTVINFQTYSSTELMTLAESLLEGNSEVLTASARRRLGHMLEDVEDRRIIDELGNVTFIRSLVKNTRELRDVRVVTGTPEPSQDDLVTLRADDLQRAVDQLVPKHAMISRSSGSLP